MSRRALLVLASAAALLSLLGVFALDMPFARLVHASGIQAWPWDTAIGYLDDATGKTISRFLLGGVLAGLSLLLLAKPATRGPGFAMLYVALVQLASALVADLAKGVFGRLRPLEALDAVATQPLWFAGGNSFPSGHTAFYVGLFLPLAFLFPRKRWLMLPVPGFVMLARIADLDHFIGDVATSVAIVALFAWSLSLAMARWLDQRSIGRTA
jgi:membrane-associated phospholipid phosphatase